MAKRNEAFRSQRPATRYCSDLAFVCAGAASWELVKVFAEAVAFDRTILFVTVIIVVFGTAILGRWRSMRSSSPSHFDGDDLFAKLCSTQADDHKALALPPPDSPTKPPLRSIPPEVRRRLCKDLR